MDVIFPPTQWPVSTWTSAVAAAGLPPPFATSTSTACLYGLPLCPASTACLYGLPLWPSSTPAAYLYTYGRLSHHITAIIVIVIVHFLFKWNIYFSLYM
jgi:hypothetical protein